MSRKILQNCDMIAFLFNAMNQYIVILYYMTLTLALTIAAIIFSISCSVSAQRYLQSSNKHNHQVLLKILQHKSYDVGQSLHPVGLIFSMSLSLNQGILQLLAIVMWLSMFLIKCLNYHTCSCHHLSQLLARNNICKEAEAGIR